MSTSESFKELQEKSKRVYEGAIQVNAKIESAEDSLNRFLPILKERYGTTDLQELEKILKENEKKNDDLFKEKSESIENRAKQVDETKEILRQIQASMK